MNDLFGYVLLAPLGLLLALVPLTFWWRHRRTENTAIRHPLRDLEVGAELGGDASSRLGLRIRTLVPRVFLGLGMALLVLAMARPAAIEMIEAQREGIDMMLVLDVSSSMTAGFRREESSSASSLESPEPRESVEGGVAKSSELAGAGRLAAAKRQAKSFMNARESDRVGLLAFARYADLRCPLTRDHRALKELIERLEPVIRDGPEDATAIGAALARASDLMREPLDRSRVIVLLTDGIENVATVDRPEEIAPLQILEFCRALGLRVYGLSLASDPRASDSQLEVLAKESGGRFFRARDEESLRASYAEIDRLETKAWPDPEPRFRELFPWFLSLGSALAILGACLLRPHAKRLPA